MASAFGQWEVYRGRTPARAPLRRIDDVDAKLRYRRTARYQTITLLRRGITLKGDAAACDIRRGSTRFPDRRVGEQTALGKSDAVDQDGSEGEADQARRHTKPPIEFG